MQLKIKIGEPEVRLHHSVTPSPDASSFERHCHGFFELIYVVNGRGRYLVEGAEYPLLPGTVLLLRPYEFHYVCPEKSCPYERYVLNFERDALFEAETLLAGFDQDKVDMGVYYFPQGSADDAVFRAFESLDTLQRFSWGEKQLNERGVLLLRSIMTEILLLLGTASPKEPVIPEKNMLFDIMGYLNEHLDETITLDDLSKRFFISKYHLCRAFRQSTGTTFLSYLTTKRIVAAQQMIKEGIAATEVAYRVGFCDYSSFYRAYRKQTGKAPARERGGSAKAARS